MNPDEYNKELITVLQFLQEKHHEFRESNRIKSNDDRRKYAHAEKTVGDIAYNCNITPKPNPNTYKTNKKKKPQQKNTPNYTIWQQPTKNNKQTHNKTLRKKISPTVYSQKQVNNVQNKRNI